MDVNKAEVAKYVVQMQNGDGQAFEKLYGATNQSGYFTALKILKNEDEAQDVLQDSYVTVLEKINDVQNPESFVSWFHQIVANKAKNYLSKRKPSLFASDEEEQEATEFIPDEDEVWQPEKNVDEDDVRRQVMEIIEGLSDEKRTCVLLYYYNEMSVADIAKSVGASENTVKARLFQARKDIRKAVEKLGKKNVTLLGVPPISVVLWALRAASRSEGAQFAAGPAAAAIMEGAAASASVGAAATSAAGAVAVQAGAVGVAQTATAAAGGIAAKIAALTVAQKVILGVVTVTAVAGAVTGTAAVVNNVKPEPETEPPTAAVEAFGESTTEELLDWMVTLPEPGETVSAEYVTEPERESAPEPTATTAAPTTTQAAERAQESTATAAASASASAAEQTTTAAYAVTVTSRPASSTTTTKPASTTKKPSTTTTTTTATTTTTTSPQVTPDPEPTTTTTTTEKVKGTATVKIKYSIPNTGESEKITSFSVTEGDAITEAMIENAVRSELTGKYTIYDIDIPDGSTVSAAEPITYNIRVIVDADEI